MVYRFGDFFYAHFPYAFHLGYNLVFLEAPAFYFYVKSVAFSDFRLTKKDLLHLLPYALTTLYMAIAFHDIQRESSGPPPIA